MNHKIYIACDGDLDKPEIQVSGASNALSGFGEELNFLVDTMVLSIDEYENKFYPLRVNNLIIELIMDGEDRLTVMFYENDLKIKGNKSAFKKLGGSLVNFFDSNSNIGDHFQLDYYDGNQILNNTNCHLIFICDR